MSFLDDIFGKIGGVARKMVAAPVSAVRQTAAAARKVESRVKPLSDQIQNTKLMQSVINRIPVKSVRSRFQPGSSGATVGQTGAAQAAKDAVGKALINSGGGWTGVGTPFIRPITGAIGKIPYSGSATDLLAQEVLQADGVKPIQWAPINPHLKPTPIPTVGYTTVPTGGLPSWIQQAMSQVQLGRMVYGNNPPAPAPGYYWAKVNAGTRSEGYQEMPISRIK